MCCDLKKMLDAPIDRIIFLIVFFFLFFLVIAIMKCIKDLKRPLDETCKSAPQMQMTELTLSINKPPLVIKINSD